MDRIREILNTSCALFIFALAIAVAITIITIAVGWCVAGTQFVCVARHTHYSDKLFSRIAEAVLCLACITVLLEPTVVATTKKVAHLMYKSIMPCRAAPKRDSKHFLRFRVIKTKRITTVVSFPARDELNDIYNKCKEKSIERLLR